MKCSFKNKRRHPFRSLMFKGRRLRRSEVLNFTSLARLSPRRPLCLLQFALPSDPPSFSSEFPSPRPLRPHPASSLSSGLNFASGLPCRGFRPNISLIVSVSPPCGTSQQTSTPLPIMPLSEPRTASRTSKCTLQRPKRKEKKSVKST